MEHYKIIAAALLASVIAIIGGVAMIHPVVNVDAPNVNVQPQTVGAVASPDLQSPYFAFGGVREWAYRKDLNSDAASTTICVFQAPQVASSSLRFFGWRADTGTGTAMVLKTYKSASQYVTTTQLGNSMPLAANTVVATTSDSVTTNSVNAIFSANDWLVVTATVAAGGAGASSPSGVCEAKFLEI